MMFKKTCYVHFLTANPRITIPFLVFRTVPGHCVWCTAEGSPFIKISIFKNTTLLASSYRRAVSKINEKGNYTCVAANDGGSDSNYLPITFVGKEHGKENLLKATCYA